MADEEFFCSIKASVTGAIVDRSTDDELVEIVVVSFDVELKVVSFEFKLKVVVSFDAMVVTKIGGVVESVGEPATVVEEEPATVVVVVAPLTVVVDAAVVVVVDSSFFSSSPSKALLNAYPPAAPAKAPDRIKIKMKIKIEIINIDIVTYQRLIRQPFQGLRSIAVAARD